MAQAPCRPCRFASSLASSSVDRQSGAANHSLPVSPKPRHWRQVLPPTDMDDRKNAASPQGGNILLVGREERRINAALRSSQFSRRWRDPGVKYLHRRPRRHLRQKVPVHAQPRRQFHKLRQSISAHDLRYHRSVVNAQREVPRAPPGHGHHPSPPYDRSLPAESRQMDRVAIHELHHHALAGRSRAHLQKSGGGIAPAVERHTVRSHLLEWLQHGSRPAGDDDALQFLRREDFHMPGRGDAGGQEGSVPRSSSQVIASQFGHMRRAIPAGAAAPTRWRL